MTTRVKVSSKLPSGNLYFNPSPIRQVLAGDRSQVTGMFIWVDTPKELQDSWEKCQDHGSFHPGRELDENQKAFLRWLLREDLEDKGEEGL